MAKQQKKELRLEPFVIILFIICLITVVGYYFNHQNVLELKKEVKKEVNLLKEQSELKEIRFGVIDDEMTKFQMITEKFAENHEFSKNYNCVNYSEDLEDILINLGYKVNSKIGCPENYLIEDEYGDKILINGNVSCHRYLEVIFEFEPQSAKIVNYDNEFPYQYNR